VAIDEMADTACRVSGTLICYMKARGRVLSFRAIEDYKGVVAANGRTET
jgi:hypothetical protein